MTENFYPLCKNLNFLCEKKQRVKWRKKHSNPRLPTSSTSCRGVQVSVQFTSSEFWSCIKSQVNAQLMPWAVLHLNRPIYLTNMALILDWSLSRRSIVKINTFPQSLPSANQNLQAKKQQNILQGGCWNKQGIFHANIWYWHAVQWIR